MLDFFVFVKDIASRLKATVNDATTLVDMYYTIGSLVLIKVLNLVNSVGCYMSFNWNSLGMLGYC